MLDKSDYFVKIEHAKCSEQSELSAYKLDDAEGIAERIGFNSNIISKVDYFSELEFHIQLIELSDLREQLKQCRNKSNYAKAGFDAIDNDAGLSKKDRSKQKKALAEEAWQSLRDEFLKKWAGSIAVIERLYRKTGQSVDIDPQYSLLIVCRDGTDTKILDELNTELGRRLNGQCNKVRNVQVCNTQHLEKFLLHHSVN